MAFLQTLIDKSKGRSWYPAVKSVCEQYAIYKPQEKQVWEQFENVRNKIYQSNIPKEHTYTLIKQ